MAAKTPEDIQIVDEIEDRQVSPEVFQKLQDALETLESAVGHLEHLSQEPGFESLGRLVPGYVWAIEQTQELNEALVTRVFGDPQNGASLDG